MSSARPLRVGSVPYVVGRPLDAGLGNEPGIQLEHDVPAQLVERLRAGDLDVALVSSIELFRRPGYRRIGGVGVCGRGPVASVQVFLRKPWEEVETVALDPASRASQTLVRVLAEERPIGPPRFLEVPAGEDPRAADADAWLRIGDAALREALEDRSLKTFNPSAVWTATTGLPFVFATWIVHPNAPIEPHLEAFARSRQVGESRRADFARQAAKEWRLPEDACATYLLEECSYEVEEGLEAPLLLFRDRASALGLCEPNERPEVLGDAALRSPSPIAKEHEGESA